jgi:hypothetical protein
MNGVIPLVAALGLLGFGAALIFIPAVADDPYRNRKFGFAKGSPTRWVFGAAAMIMGAIQMLVWLNRYL